MFKKAEEFKNVEKNFFVIDEEKKTARVDLRFEKVSDVFDVNYATLTPVFSDDFSDWIYSALSLVPRKYKVDLIVSFEDTEGYSEEELSGFFKKNVLLDYKSRKEKTKSRGYIAYGLIAVGAVLFAVMMLLKHLLFSGTAAEEIVLYVLDIATTVTFWEAMSILVVERHELRMGGWTLLKRFSSIRFVKRGQEEGKR